jgi:alpha-L-fucosidase
VGKVLFKTSPESRCSANRTRGEENSLTRFVKARELVDTKNKERIEKLKSMLGKWLKQEKRAKEYSLEVIEERKYKSYLKQQRLSQVKTKADMIVKMKEDQSIRDFKALV